MNLTKRAEAGLKLMIARTKNVCNALTSRADGARSSCTVCVGGWVTNHIVKDQPLKRAEFVCESIIR